MKPRKSIFSYFVIVLYMVGLLYLLVCGVAGMGESREYPYTVRGAFFVLLLGIWLLINSAAALAARLQIEDLAERKARAVNIAEAVFAGAILAASAWLRWKVIREFPMRPASDFKTYYEIAELMAHGALVADGEGYCDYIAMFPHVFGYPYALSKIFSAFGTSVETAQYFNLALAVGTVFLVYRTARLAGGRISGLCALALAAFWPSQILYVNMVASEFLFSFLLMLSVYLFVLSMKKCTVDAPHPGLGILLHIAIGATLALCAAVRPMALILLITIILCILPQKQFVPAMRREDMPLSSLTLSQGWVRCAIIVLCYFLVSASTGMIIERTIERETAPGSASFGYNMLVGLNTQSEGGWNAEDAALLEDTYAQTQDAEKAHMACRDLAIQRLMGDPESIFNLMMRKYQILWGNDDYGGTWNITLLGEQGELTAQRSDFLYGSRDFCNLYYLLAAVFSGIAGIFLWKKGNDIEYVFVLVFVGTVGMHMFVEIQNRYHYHALFMLAMLAGCAVSEIYRMNRAKVLARRKEQEAARQLEQEKAKRLERLHADEEEYERLRQEAMQSRFDMQSALEQNLIKVSVSEAYRKEAQKEDDEKQMAVIS